MSLTPEKFRDEGWSMAYEEMRRKQNTCTCGMEKIQFHFNEIPTMSDNIKKTVGIFNEETLRLEIESMWGTHGAQSEVYRDILKKISKKND